MNFLQGIMRIAASGIGGEWPAGRLRVNECLSGNLASGCHIDLRRRVDWGGSQQINRSGRAPVLALCTFICGLNRAGTPFGVYQFDFAILDGDRHTVARTGASPKVHLKAVGDVILTDHYADPTAVTLLRVDDEARLFFLHVRAQEFSQPLETGLIDRLPKDRTVLGPQISRDQIANELAARHPAHLAIRARHQTVYFVGIELFHTTDQTLDGATCIVFPVNISSTRRFSNRRDVDRQISRARPSSPSSLPE